MKVWRDSDLQPPCADLSLLCVWHWTRGCRAHHCAAGGPQGGGPGGGDQGQCGLHPPTPGVQLQLWPLPVRLLPHDPGPGGQLLHDSVPGLSALGCHQGLRGAGGHGHWLGSGGLHRLHRHLHTAGGGGYSQH